jgi:hypothetical protein
MSQHKTDEEILHNYWAAHTQFGPFDVGPEEHLRNVRAKEKEAADKQRQIDISNLRFYAEMFKQHQWSTVAIHWGVFEQTLREIADRIDGEFGTQS